MEVINQSISRFLEYLGIDKSNLDWSVQLALILGVVVISFLCTKIFRHLIIPTVKKLTAKTKATWDDYLFNERMMVNFSRIIPPIVWYGLLPFVFSKAPALMNFLMKATEIYLVVAIILLANAFLTSLYSISSEHETLRNRPLKGVYQTIKLVVIGVGVVIILSIILGEDATIILAGFGASATVLMLIFKDSILGLVAGVQLSANDMLRPGDWITMPKYGANGDVIEVSLTTVKVRNFDKTITTIPPYALVSDSFQNWRGMRETGGRRIMRSVNIDVTSVHFCTKEELSKFTEKGWISEADAGKPIVNFQVFRNYLLTYLNQHPRVSKEQMIMVRQLQPTAEGMPMEVYCFTNTTVWQEYEEIQSEIFDHLLAVVGEFNLRIFQRPGGTDFHPNRYRANT